MKKNKLIAGEPRLGWFVDGNPDTEQIAVMLRDTGVAIELTVPLKGLFDRDDPYGRWWSHGVHYGDDPDRNKYSYGPPRVLLVHDKEGPVVLVGCRSSGSSMSPSVGQGKIVANFAVLGGRNLKYEKINGLRTEIPALASWTRLSSMKVEFSSSENNRVKSVQMTLGDAPSIPLARAMNLTMKSSWRTENPSGRFLAYEGVKLDTTVRNARKWEEHLNLHGAVLDLVSVAAWKPFGYTKIEVYRTDDSDRNIAGEDLGGRWLQVATHRIPKHDPWSKEPRFLFPYSEVGPQGVSRWLRLRRIFGQAIGPLLEILRSEDRWSHSSLVQSGIALESLGYLIDTIKNGGANLNNRKQIQFRRALQVILDDMEATPFADTSDWISRANEVYMGSKHPDRPEPDSLVMLNTLRENILVLRYWIALEVGVAPEVLNQRLAMDPLSDEFIPLT